MIQPSIGHALRNNLGMFTTSMRDGSNGWPGVTVRGTFNPAAAAPTGAEGPGFALAYQGRYGILKTPAMGQWVVESALSEEDVRRAVGLGVFGDVELPSTSLEWRTALTDLVLVQAPGGGGFGTAYEWMLARVAHATPPVDPPPPPPPPIDPPPPPPPPPVDPPAPPLKPLAPLHQSVAEWQHRIGAVILIAKVPRWLTRLERAARDLGVEALLLEHLIRAKRRQLGEPEGGRP